VLDDRRRTDAQRLGDTAEALVAARLTASGWTVLGRNVRVGRLELDLVAVDPGPPATLVVVEVRWRARRDYGLPEETIDHRKRTHLRAGALGLVEKGAVANGADPLPRLPLRIDLVVVEPPSGTDREPRVRHHRAIG
jgi:putative endonuclease